MNNISAWAVKHGIGYDAMNELLVMMGINTELVVPDGAYKSEAAIQNLVRLEATQKGLRLWRNNVGAGMLDNGSFIRWGLCNETKAMNKQNKSSDLIGIRPVLITMDMVGHTIGQFVARETKKEDWVYTGTEHEVGQLNFIQLVVSLGGDAAFANREGTL